MEYVLKNDLFNMLAVIAEKEKLIGIKLLVLKFMTNLINHLKNPALAHQSFFFTIQVKCDLRFILKNFTYSFYILFLEVNQFMRLCSV